MAIYFQNLGLLNELVTGYPKKYVTPFGIQRQHIKSLYINEIINRTTNFLGIGYPLDFWACEAFDLFASKFIKYDSDVYFIWSGYALNTIKTLRKKNPKAKIILVRGSAHIQEQEILLKRGNNSKAQQINRKIIKKELAEYDACDFITVPSTFAYNSFLKNGFHLGKLFKNILGVEMAAFPFKKKDIPGNKISIGYVGTLSKQKNVASLIDVIKQLNKDAIQYKLILAGPIEHSSFDVELLKQDFIEYYGKLPQNELYKIYQQVDVFVLNSSQDGFGIVVLQAMSSGCPVIATENSGGPDVISAYKNGILVPAFDNFALKQAIIWFYQNQSEIPSMGKVSRAISENGFTWEDFGRRNMEFINKLKS